MSTVLLARGKEERKRKEKEDLYIPGFLYVVFFIVCWFVCVFFGWLIPPFLLTPKCLLLDTKEKKIQNKKNLWVDPVLVFIFYLLYAVK